MTYRCCETGLGGYRRGSRLGCDLGQHEAVRPALWAAKTIASRGLTARSNHQLGRDLPRAWPVSRANRLDVRLEPRLPAPHPGQTRGPPLPSSCFRFSQLLPQLALSLPSISQVTCSPHPSSYSPVPGSNPVTARIPLGSKILSLGANSCSLDRPRAESRWGTTQGWIPPL